MSLERILERLAEMFPKQAYQSRLEQYINSKTQPTLQKWTIGNVNMTLNHNTGVADYEIFLTATWRILTSVGEARHGAWLARQGRITEAKALYK